MISPASALCGKLQNDLAKMIYWVQSMNKHFQLISLLTILMFWYVSTGFAQDDEATTSQASGADVEETAPDNEEVPAGQEVEINEDNYRQFMELKDARQQRDMLPENSYQSQAGAQKIDKLPEESQKHLRNELREIIIQGDEWQPGDEETDYPYVPSKPASTNQALQKQEVEAWGELVDNYHKREAEIYGNASRSKAASTTAGANGEGPGEGEGSAGGNMGQGGEGQQASQQNNLKQSSTAGGYSPDSSNDPNATSTEGVSQNAMEFLQGQGNQVANAGEANTASSEESNEQADGQAVGQAEAQTDGQADAQTDGQANTQAGEQADGQAQADQQSTDELNRTANTSTENIAPPSSDQSESDSTAGASQNALEYLTGGNGRTDQEGTLTIEDLINAQGVRGATSADLPPNSASDKEEPDRTPTDDGGAP